MTERPLRDFTIERPRPEDYTPGCLVPPDSVHGSAIDVSYGALLVYDAAGDLVHVYAPGQWLKAWQE